MARRYRDAAAKLQQNVQKHLKEMKELSSSEDEDPCESTVLETMFQSYWRGGGDTQMLNRTKNLLEEAISGRSVTCLICISSIKKSHAIWTCDHCFAYFHLSCIQKWSNDSISLRSEESTGPIAVIKQQKIEWCCPKCRNAYSKEEIPRKYRCFCGKTDDPPHHPWLIPHTCGEVCGKRLSTGDNCKHKCLLLCHPGPCPPCPQTVNGICFCEKERKRVRCSAATWSCGQVCKKTLLCKAHYCKDVCHSATEEMLSCKQQCPKNLDCGHRCRNTCHSGACGNQVCTKKTKVHCPCSNIKKEAPCNSVRTGETKIMCDETCEAKKKAAKIEQEKEKQRLKELEEEKNRRELAEYEWKLSGKKKKYKEKKMVVGKDDRGFLKRYWVPISSFLVMMLASIYYIFYVGLD
ncbi:hypothetical protein PYW07_009350 [Mythimna separata]|uniref:NF-X1-type zinc finger protein NFXL1 n=1 Tax=Mythimna separata TaxID=271217 RepID=A0AAD8DMI6_MYTSE|nr:hypothetical protein PYW07_009350 [Mythimna separata]